MEPPKATLGTKVSNLFRSLGRKIRITLGWRFYLVAAIWLVSVLATWVLQGVPGWADVATFRGAVFAGWVASLVFFTVIGVAVALVSLARPEEDAFDSRARILFRHQSGKHIDYIVSKMKGEFEHYSERYDALIEIVGSFAKPATGGQAAGAMFRLQESCRFVQKAYIDDITSESHAKLDYSEVSSPPTGGEPNKFVRLRINGKPIFTSETFTSGYQRDFRITTEPYGRAEVDFELLYWVDTGEKNSFAPIRYTQELTLVFSNKTAGPCSIAFQRGTAPVETIKLGAGEEKTMSIRDLVPNENAYEFVVAP